MTDLDADSPAPARPPAWVEVAVALLWRDGRLLARQRRPHEHLPGVWEFPGGKIRAGESPEDAAAREVREEMGLEASALRLVETIEHRYADRSVRLFLFDGEATGEPAPHDGAAWAWLTPAELAARPIPEANRALVERLVRAAARTRG